MALTKLVAELADAPGVPELAVCGPTVLRLLHLPTRRRPLNAYERIAWDGGLREADVSKANVSKASFSKAGLRQASFKNDRLF